MPDEVLAIDELLAILGYGTPEARRVARAALEAAGLTNARKRNIAADKRGAVEAALAASVLRACSDPHCQSEAAATSKRRATVERAYCQVCEGSPNASAAQAMARALLEARRPSLLVVGGSPNARAELDRLLAGTGVKLRMVDGTVALPGKRAEAWAQSADVIAVWGGTQLDHKVSSHFMRPEYVAKRVNLVQRGIAALADGVVRHLEGGRSAVERP